MKKARFLLAIVVIAMLVVACAPAAEDIPTVPTSIAGTYLNTDYTDATSLRNQLAYGTLLLDGTDNAISPEQAQSMIPLWQVIIALSGNETTADEELTAVQDQIVNALTKAQLQAITGMQLTNTQLNAFYAEYGIVFPTPLPGATKEPSSGKNISEEDRAATHTAAQALGTPVGTGSSTGQAAKTMLFEKVIEYLTGLTE